MEIPQDQATAGLAAANLQSVQVTLPDANEPEPGRSRGALRVHSHPDRARLHDPSGMPPSSRIGEAEVHTPMLTGPLDGSVYLAASLENPFSSLLAVYILATDPATGTVVSSPAKSA